MSFDLNKLKDLLSVANKSAKHGPALSGIHNAVMDELKKFHDELTVERVERGKQEATDAAAKEAERVAKARVEEERDATETVHAPEPESRSDSESGGEAVVDRRGIS